MRKRLDTTFALLPGLGLVLLLAIGARFLHGVLPARAAELVGEVIIAVLLGLLVGNLVPLSASFAPGIKFSFARILPAAIVLLGARFSFQQVIAIGGRALIMIAILMTLALLVAHGLGRLLGVPAKLATLIGVGTAICGNSAISATAPVIKARDEDVSFAIATNTLLGTLAVFFYPALGHALGLTHARFGTWAGTAVNDTSQVVAAGFAFSQKAGEIATAVKLTRNALMGVVIVLMGFFYTRGGEGERRHTSLFATLKQSLPIFVIGFLLMAVLNSLGAIAWAAGATGLDLMTGLKEVAQFLILLALTAVGLGTRVSTLRAIGLKPFYLGVATTATTSLTSLLLIYLLGPAGQ